jgi:hypothetical protein
MEEEHDVRLLDRLLHRHVLPAIDQYFTPLNQSAPLPSYLVPFSDERQTLTQLILPHDPVVIGSPLRPPHLLMRFCRLLIHSEIHPHPPNQL